MARELFRNFVIAVVPVSNEVVMPTTEEDGSAALSSSVSVAIVSDPHARSLIATNVFDRVSILPNQLEYALVPAAVCSRLNAPSLITDQHLPALCASRDGFQDDDDIIYATVDDQLVYARFFADFGPLDLSQTVRFCRDLTSRLTTLKPPTKIVIFSSDHPHKRANTMTLLALFVVLVHKQTPQEAVRPFQRLRPAQGFRDAACGVCTYFLTVFDCAQAVDKAVRSRIWSYETFSLEEYEHYDQLHNGDINWIVPGKILAFSGPQLERVVLDAQGRTTRLAHEYAKVFQTLGVSCVVRFNEPTTYDRRAFIHANIRHLDMHYPDGGNPTDEILFKFIRTCERERGAVAVHCKAGLGRTGTNIAGYLMKKHRFSASEAIAWCRICRPGSIVGPQQQYLVVKQRQLWERGAVDDQQQQKDEQPRGPTPEIASCAIRKQSFSSMLERLPPASTSTDNRSKRSAVRKSSPSRSLALVKR